MNRAQTIALQLEKVIRETLPATLIAVSKYSKAEEIVYAYHAGQRDFGENRVQDLIEKAAYFEKEGLHDVRWHFIGHLQSNKVKDLLKIPNLVAIHSIDSEKLVLEIVKRAGEFTGSHLNLFFQVNTSFEDEKSGFENLDDILNSHKAIEDLELNGKFHLHGLMTMATVRTDDKEKEAHRCFSLLLKYREDLVKILNRDLKLSMGMSGDFSIALLYQTDYVRIGSAIFK